MKTYNQARKINMPTISNEGVISFFIGGTSKRFPMLISQRKTANGSIYSVDIYPNKGKGAFIHIDTDHLIKEDLTSPIENEDSCFYSLSARYASGEFIGGSHIYMDVMGHSILEVFSGIASLQEIFKNDDNDALWQIGWQISIFDIEKTGKVGLFGGTPIFNANYNNEGKLVKGNIVKF